MNYNNSQSWNKIKQGHSGMIPLLTIIQVTSRCEVATTLSKYLGVSGNGATPSNQQTYSVHLLSADMVNGSETVKKFHVADIVIQHSYGKWPPLLDVPFQQIVILHSYVEWPEASNIWTYRYYIWTCQILSYIPKSLLVTSNIWWVPTPLLNSQ